MTTPVSTFLTNFNPRSREGSDIKTYPFPNILLISIRAPARGATLLAADREPQDGISIRAPARGATQTALKFFSTNLFQSALPRGERLYRKISIYKCTLFQSALPRGERHIRAQDLTGSNDFNPRSREGSDPKGRGTYRRGYISIRAPARGATENLPKEPENTAISIRAPARGATCYVHFFPVIRQFQSALPRGERPFHNAPLA